MIKRIIILFSLLVCGLPLTAQSFGLKNNLIGDATTSLNLGIEIKTGTRNTLVLPVSYNPWTFSDNRKFKHILFQPEYRWWKCEPFTGHFWGVHIHGAFYNVGGVGFTDYMKDHRFQGWLVGAGVSYGYNWILAPRWSLEATLGLGYAYISYEKYLCQKCERLIEESDKHYVGPTKVGLTLVFLIK